jgi:hypothetical protein
MKFGLREQVACSSNEIVDYGIQPRETLYLRPLTHRPTFWSVTLYTRGASITVRMCSQKEAV